MDKLAEITINNVNTWINLLSTFSTILLGVFGALAVVLGFLVWKQDRMRKAAEMEMKKIQDISGKINKLYSQYVFLINEQKNITKKTAKEISKKKANLDNLLNEIKNSGDDVEKIKRKIQSISKGISIDLDRLSTVSYSPSYLDKNYFTFGDSSGKASFGVLDPQTSMVFGPLDSPGPIAPMDTNLFSELVKNKK